MARQFKWGLSKQLQDERREAYARIKQERESRRCPHCKLLFKTRAELEAHQKNI